ncbi:MAG: hypothetical protein K0U38_05950 [Epsilonproteobacteria bacterium]|nr:hypothetical protein [Campylobacterota bacterium]
MCNTVIYNLDKLSPCSGRSRITRLMGMASSASELSKMPNKVGAVAIKNDRIVGVGCNGYPSKVDFEKYTREAVVHAEVNCILNSHLPISEIDEIIIYGLPPCPDCLKLLFNKVSKIIYYTNTNIPTHREWEDNFQNFYRKLRGE